MSSSDPGIEIAARLRLVCEAHDASIGPHLDRVSRYAWELGRLLGLSKSELAELRHAAPLHDLGAALDASGHATLKKLYAYVRDQIGSSQTPLLMTGGLGESDLRLR